MVAFMALNINLQHRRDSEYNWEMSNPILADGEIIIVQTETSGKRIKIGDGVSNYKNLPFSDSLLEAKINELQTSSGLFSNVEYISSTNWTIDVSKGSCFIMDNLEFNLAGFEFSFEGVPAGKGACFTLIITNGGGKTVRFPPNTMWANNEPPQLTEMGYDVLTFITMDGGTTWYGSPSIINARNDK
jgi:hypothetical protein